LVTLDNVSKRYGGRAVLAPVSLELAPGKTTVLIGPSGCGKSTLLRIIVGLLASDTGEVRIGGRLLTPSNVDAARHGIGYVIQDGGLFPHLTGNQNVVLLSRWLGWPVDRQTSRVAELARLVRLPVDVLTRYPRELSGGQRQRIGLMRALMLDPPLLLLDEPLGALDPITRFKLQEELKGIFETLQKTVVLVTHDMGEAAYFGDTIMLMRDGRIVQAGPYADLARQPSEPFVSEFIRAQRGVLADLPT
jgi:osmoprotectant transport system ATP-binding protein